MKYIRDTIQPYLDNQNHNWSWLSDVTGLSRSVTYGIKNNSRNNITLRNITKIALALNMDMNDLKVLETQKSTSMAATTNVQSK
ncbi:Xre family transcriptional regulator [Weissella oryzae SG25]|uniref:Xre family transcriptional regulator n=1 Tax=Weissella oryzae (strain DSM 25784 / JCM 18191 / LMG 30913 / SG25) TaxID=1329250 RepID=A0A069CSM9_WEIOS|nr:Xre family transcriptional regulator [Weissella oryzae SG25]